MGRDAAADAMHAFAGALVSAAEQLRTPDQPGLLQLPPAAEAGLGGAASPALRPPTAGEMAAWRQQWRQRHRGDDWQEAEEQPAAGAPHAEASPPAVLDPQSCLLQRRAHPNRSKAQQAQQASAASTTLPLFVGGGSISPRGPEASPQLAANAAAGQSAAATAASVIPAGRGAHGGDSLLPLQPWHAPVAAAAVAAARQAAEVAAAAAAAAALPPVVGPALLQGPMLAALQGRPATAAAAFPAFSEAGSTEGARFLALQQQPQTAAAAAAVEASAAADAAAPPFTD
jgi:hypothetical protein